MSALNSDPDAYALNVFALKLLDKAAARKQVLSHDRVAEALEEIVDAITETLDQLKRERRASMIVGAPLQTTPTCGRAHEIEHEPARPSDAPPLIQ